jgi:hypothetical protein
MNHEEKQKVLIDTETLAGIGLCNRCHEPLLHDDALAVIGTGKQMEVFHRECWEEQCAGVAGR